MPTGEPSPYRWRDNTHGRPSHNRAVNRDALGVLALATVTVLAIAVGAAAIDAPRQAGGSGPAIGGGGGAVPGDEWAFDLGKSSHEVTETVPFPSWLLSALAVVVLVAFLIALYVLRNEIGVDELKTVAVLSLVLGAVLTVFYFLLQFLGGSNDTGNGSGAFGENTRVLSGGGGSGSLDGATRTLTTDPPLLALVAAALLVGTVVVLRSGRTADEGTEEEPTRAGTATPAEFGRAAGRAADRIADGTDVDNEVYRAWREMADQVDIGNPSSRTPGEFVRAATDAGMARDDVVELTDLFRAVRYGGRGVTDDHEARAVAALRRIEDEYAEEP